MFTHDIMCGSMNLTEQNLWNIQNTKTWLTHAINILGKFAFVSKTLNLQLSGDECSIWLLNVARILVRLES